MYKLIRKILFLFPPEGVHHFSMKCMKIICAFAPARWLIKQVYRPRNAGLSRRFLGLSFKNPVGLGAGFDKNAKYLRELETLGFGFAEIGTVTPLPQEGNEKPRVFRLPKDKALINRMGFNNDGVQVIARRLKRWKEKREERIRDSHVIKREISLVIGGNIGKNKSTPNEDAWKD